MTGRVFFCEKSLDKFEKYPITAINRFSNFFICK